MQNIFAYFKKQAIESLDVAKMQWKSFAIAVFFITVIYIFSVTTVPGWFTYFVGFAPALICALTSLARLNDIGVECHSKRWHIRRFGLILAGAGSVMYLASPIIGEFPTWRSVVFVWGVGLSWLTTPNMPPWYAYITGEYLNGPGPHSPLSRFLAWVTGETHCHVPKDSNRRRRHDDGDGP